MTNEIGENVTIALEGAVLKGTLRVPDDAEGVVVFACANCQRSCKADFLANLLPQNSLATVRVDLLTSSEDALYEDRLDLEMLTNRLAAVVRWTRTQLGLGQLPLGLFGVGTSGSSALKLAASPESPVAAVVVWDGRPDLAGKFLAAVKPPTLFIVGEKDDLVRGLNQVAFDKLGGEKELVVIAGATHKFEDFGAMEAVGERAADWFSSHLALAKSR